MTVTVAVGGFYGDEGKGKEGDGSESQEQEWHFHELQPSDFLRKPTE